MINTYLYSNFHSAGQLFTLDLALPNVSVEVFSVLLLFVFFCSMINIELRSPHNIWPIKKWAQSCSTNIGLFIFNNVVLSLLSLSSVLMFADVYSGFGLLSQVSNVTWKILFSFLLLDFVTYGWHICCHRWNWLWMFHKVHHSDPYLNVSTTFRLHIVELFLFVLVKVLFLIVLGVDKSTALVCEVVATFFVILHHTNISFSGEKLLGRILIVPALHRTHHSMERYEHDQNFGAVLSIWDQIFGTFSNAQPLKIGIKDKCGLGFFDQLKFGFNANTAPNAPSYNLNASNYSMIETAAYYKALHRNFVPGNEVDDWLQAEAEVCNRS